MLSRTHPAYEFRRGQLSMAQAIEQALEERRHLIVEAGTGTGKTLAYLLPVLRSGKRVIISTGTKTLQEQLFFKDVPFLEEALFASQPVDANPAPEKGTPTRQGERRLRVCYMKGRNNYLCRKKLYDLANAPILTGLEEVRALSRHQRMGENHRHGRSRGVGGAARKRPTVAAAGRARGELHRHEMPAVGSLLHHRDASARRRKAMW